MTSEPAELSTIDIVLIDFSPLNYRKFFPQDSLQHFASELKVHGIISPLMVRPMPSGRYQLIAGERRFRAALIAQIQQVPVVIRSLTDEEVIEIQLAENIQRENPHPMHEALAIGQMQRKHKTIEEIAARLGKSKQFVYTRLKLVSLVEPFQEMFLADVLTIQQAVDIASIAADAQQQLFDDHCDRWQKNNNFQLHDLDYLLRGYRYDLRKAPFNIKDKKLMESAGACTHCSSNTATLKSLFPELAKQTVCNNPGCYQKKCTMHLFNEFEALFVAEQPTAFLFVGEPAAVMEHIISLLPQAATLPRYDSYAVSIVRAPEEPDREDFNGYGDNEFDEAGYNEALQEYAEELDRYQQQIADESVQKALYCTAREIVLVHFALTKPQESDKVSGYNGTVTAKAVQEALKNGTATAALLENEIERIRSKEIRSQEIDREKVQAQIHEQFTNRIKEGQAVTLLTAADKLAARLVIYQSLDYNGRQFVNQLLLPEKENDEQRHPPLLEWLAALTAAECSCLMRAALLNKPESKYPAQDAAKCLVQVAENAGLNVAAIEAEQQQKAAKRQASQQARIDQLEIKIKKLNAQDV